MDNTVECPSLRVRNEVECIENLLKKGLRFCLLLTGSRYIFLRFAAKNTRTDGAAMFVRDLFPSPSVRVRNVVERIENLLKRSADLSAIHWFSIHFSPLRCEKNSNGRCRSVCQRLIPAFASSGAERSGVYREFVEKSTLLFVNPRFSIHFSSRYCEKNSNGRYRSVGQRLISVSVCSSAQQSGVYQDLLNETLFMLAN